MPIEKRGTYDHPDAGIYKVDPHVPDKVCDKFQIRLRNPASGYYKETVNGRMYARERLAEIRKELNGGMAPAKRKREQTVRTVLEAMIASKNLRPNTITGYRDTLDNHILPKLGEMAVAKLEGQELFLTGFFAQVEHRSGKEARRLVEMHIRALCRYATRNGLLNRNPLEGVRWAKRTHVRGTPYCPITEDLHRVRATIRTNTNGTRPGEAEMTIAFTDTLAGLGLRVSEAAGLSEDEIDRKHDMLRVVRQLIYVPLTPAEVEAGVTRPVYCFAPAKTDESGDRRVPIPKFVSASWAASRLRNGVREVTLPYLESAYDITPEALRRDLPTQTHSLLFFSLRDGEGTKQRFAVPGNQPYGLSGLRGRLRRISAQLALSGSLHPHAYRHYYTTMLSEAGVAQRIIDHVTGHVPQGVTNRVYVHVTDPGLETARTAITRTWGTPGGEGHEVASISS